MSSDDDLSALNAGACPTVESLDVIGTQWRLNVLYALQDGEQRFNALKESTGASSRTLSGTLETLQEHGLVERRTEEAAPIAVYYRLTPKGEALESVFGELESWAREHHLAESGGDGRAEAGVDSGVETGASADVDTSASADVETSAGADVDSPVDSGAESAGQ